MIVLELWLIPFLNELNKPECINILMPPLIHKWNSLSDEDLNLVPLLECLTSISSSLEFGFQNFAGPVFSRCLRLIENTLIKDAAASEKNSGHYSDYPDKEFMVCALDLISGMIDGLGGGMESLVANSNLVQLLIPCAKDIRADVRQSTFATVGDVAKNCVVHLKPIFPELFPLLVKNLTYDYVAVCNNACWAIGEIAQRIGDEMQPYVQIVLSRLIPMLLRKGSSSNDNLTENIALTIGRLGIACPDLVAPHLEEFIQPWCDILRSMRDHVDKDSAFRGLCKLIKANPNGIMKHFVFVCDAIASWEQPQNDLRNAFHSILHGFKASMQPNWDSFFVTYFPPNLREDLQSRYQL